MAEMTTTRDLYAVIANLVKQRSGCALTLQAYLENLRQRARQLRDREAIAVGEFAELLHAAFEGPDAADAPPDAAPSEGFLAWQERIDEQIRDLEEMRHAGTLDDEHRYFGVDAPRGGRWYNFDPSTYLECATAGTFGGWQEGDDTGRAYVPGPVAVVDASGIVTSVDPRDLEEPVVELRPITWEMFVDFLECGQWYE